MVIHVYLLKDGGRDYFPCHAVLILPLNHLAVSPTSPQNHTPAPVPGNQDETQTMFAVREQAKEVCQDCEDSAERLGEEE